MSVYIFIYIIAVLISSFSQILLKMSSKKIYSNKIKEYLNLCVISSYSVYVIVTIASIFALKYIPLSCGVALESLGYVFVAILGWFFFNEKLSLKKWLGLSVLIIGVTVTCF